MEDETAPITRNQLQGLYKNYVHIGRKEEDLEKLKQQGREYLRTVKFKRKFIFLTFEVFLKEVITRIQDQKPETFSDIQKGFSNLEKYGIKLLQYPWRKEFHSIKLYSSFFKHEIEPKVPKIIASPILQLYGYKEKSKDELTLQEPMKFEYVLELAFELFLASIELEVMLEIAKEAELYTDLITLDDIIKARVKTVGDVQEAKEYLKLKAISSDRKRIKLDETSQENERKRSQSAMTVKNLRDQDHQNISSRSFPPETSTRQMPFPEGLMTSNTSRGGPTKVTHIASHNGVDMISDKELYGSDEPEPVADALSEADLYGVSPMPTFKNHYPQAIETERQSDYVDMSGLSNDEYYQVMNMVQRPPNHHDELPPPTYDLAVDPRFPDNMKDWVMVPDPPQNYDATSTIPGISGLNITENGSHNSEHKERMGNGHFLSDSEAKRQGKKEKNYSEHVHFDNIEYSASSHSIRDPSAVTTVTYHTRSSCDDAKDRQSSSNLQFLNGYEKRQTQSKVSSESYENDKEAIVGQSSATTSKRSDPVSSSTTRDRSSSGKSSHVTDLEQKITTQGEKDYLSTSKRTVPISSSTTRDRSSSSKSSHIMDFEQKSTTKDEQEYLARKDSQKRYCVVCTNEATRECTLCNKVCCKHCTSVLNTLPCEGATVHRIVERNKPSKSKERLRDGSCVYCEMPWTHECHFCKAKSCSVCHHAKTLTDKCVSSVGHFFRPATSSLKDELKGDGGNGYSPQKGFCTYCNKPSTHECQVCKIKSCSVCHHVKGITDQCKSSIGHVFRALASSDPLLDKELQQDLNNSNICEMCGLTATFICADCHNRICKQCQNLYDKDLCAATKKSHFFQLITSQTKIEPKEKPWDCGRCTFSNPPQNKICAMCATSRGVTEMEYPRSGSRKCLHCTYGNAEDARICGMCSRSLDRSQAESYI